MKHLSKVIGSTVLAAMMGTSFTVTAYAAEGQRVSSSSSVIQFNRLKKPETRRHLPPIQEDIRDPSNTDAEMLQPPMEVFNKLPRFKSGLGNGVAWMEALDTGKIQPLWDLNDPNAEPMVMDMNVVRVPRGKMPNVVFPHRQHTEWLDCSNCHPDIFIPQKGANQISMAAIILGEKCGVCHGKVAFPVSECKLCHSQPKKTARGGN